MSKVCEKPMTKERSMKC